MTIPLPSRNEKCVFSLKPISHTVGDFVDMLKFEDKGIDSIFIKNMDGVRIASKTSIQTLFDQVLYICTYDVKAFQCLGCILYYVLTDSSYLIVQYVIIFPIYFILVWALSSHVRGVFILLLPLPFRPSGGGRGEFG